MKTTRHSHLAISNWQGRIAPVFDVSRQLELLEVEHGVASQRQTLSLPPELNGKLQELASHQVTDLICGAISRPLQDMLHAQGILVHAFVAGHVEDVLMAFIKGRLQDPAYAMPGCCGRRRRARHGSSGCQRFNLEEED